MLARWLSAILVIACLVLGSRPAASAPPRPTGGESEAFETTQGCPLVRSSKRSGAHVRAFRRGSSGSIPPAVLPGAIATPARGQASIDELVAAATGHGFHASHAASARAPPRR